jgi:hypothetical protein
LTRSPWRQPKSAPLVRENDQELPENMPPRFPQSICSDDLCPDLRIRAQSFSRQGHCGRAAAECTPPAYVDRERRCQRVLGELACLVSCLYLRKLNQCVSSVAFGAVRLLIFQLGHQYEIMRRGRSARSHLLRRISQTDHCARLR